MYNVRCLSRSASFQHTHTHTDSLGPNDLCALRLCVSVWRGAITDTEREQQIKVERREKIIIMKKKKKQMDGNIIPRAQYTFAPDKERRITREAHTIEE